MYLVLPTLLIWVLQCASEADFQEGCESPQYLELDQRGTIQCYFNEGFLGVFWYESEDYANDKPILSYKDSKIFGDGHKSGELSIWSNGSLIINNVSVANEHVYTAIKLNTLQDDPFPHTVRVITAVTPKQPFPVITECENDRQICLRSLDTRSKISCSVFDARPMVKLAWFERKSSDDKKTFTGTNVTSKANVTFTSQCTTNMYFNDDEVLKLYVCKASTLPSLLQKMESMVLVQRSDKTRPSSRPVLKYFERSSSLELQCTKKNILFAVWRLKGSVEFHFENIAYAILAEYNFTETFAEKYKLGNSASLAISQVQVVDEGFYDCIYGDGTFEDVSSYHIGVYVVPDSSYPVVEGCENQKSCFLEVENEGNLTCAVKGIRPQVGLEWRVVYKDTSDEISFTKQQLIVKDNGDSFDVSLKAVYHTNLRYGNVLTIECIVSGRHATLFDLSRRVDLLFVTGTHVEEENGNGLLWLLPPLVIGSLIVVFVILTAIKKRGCRKRKRLKETPLDDEETLPMTKAEKREIFVNQLKAKYEEMYAGILPIPYLRDKYFCVDKIFVNGGIEFLPSNESGKETWLSVDSYQSLFDDSRLKSSRIILEGHPGYGKSTLCLQMAYDWCYNTSKSRLDSVEILILLQLRKLEGVMSIFEAIRNFILPYDTTLTVDDIKTIVATCTKNDSLLVILDGYDEFPDKDQDTDVTKILERKMFQVCDVILTTRPFNFPRKFSVHSKRVRLTGFDEDARQKYILKSVTSNENEAEIIESRLKKNPVLKDLCQVPLFFVTFAHITQERKEDLKFNSVTIYFQYMVSCFHKHMQNKIEEKDLREKYEKLEGDHQSLDKVASENLRQIDEDVWETSQVEEKIGKDCYEQYVKIGILVEEKVIKIRGKSDDSKTPFIQYKRQVRFYHRVFREWYAAYYLSNCIAKSHTDCEDFLENLPPSELPDTYRFVCGLNYTAAEKIIHSLELAGNMNFKLLCILERDGKVDNILNTLREECADTVNIRNDDDILKQKSILQLIKIASHHKIPLTTVRLWYSFNSVDTFAKNIILKSGLILPNLQTIQEIVILEEGREIKEREVTRIFDFAIKCAALTSLGFSRCLLPCCITSEFRYTLNTLQSQGVKVWWYPTMDSPQIYLNLDSGRWKDPEEGTDITDKAYSQKVDTFRDQWRYTPWQVARGTQHKIES